MLKDTQKGRGAFRIKQFRYGKLIAEVEIQNATTTVGMNYILEAALGAGSVITSWFAGLVNNAGYSGGVVGDTMASHAGWTEFTTYSEATRVAWSPDTASGAAIQNTGSPMTFTISTAGTIIGCFITSSNTKSGTSGTLWAMAPLLSGALSVAIADVLQITYGYALT